MQVWRECVIAVVVVSIVSDKDNASDSGALEPLYIIDGKIVDKKAVDKLDVNKIESINVVKDQYAAKRYTDETKAGVRDFCTFGKRSVTSIGRRISKESGRECGYWQP